jgi:phosphotransacetylase
LKWQENIKPKKIVCIAADDEDVIDAIHDAIELGMIEATLIGPMPRITEILLTHQYSMDHITIIDCDNYEFGSEQAMRMVHMEGQTSS